MTAIDSKPPKSLGAARWQQSLKDVFGSYFFRVVLNGLITIWAVITCTFILIRQMPGNPFDIYVDRLVNIQGVPYDQAIKQAAGLFNFDPDATLFEQYLSYMANLLTGDLGQSIRTGGTPVIEQIVRFLPWTLFSVGLGLLVSFILGIVLGTLIAYWRGSWFDNIMTSIASITYGIPDYVILFLILIVFGVQLGWFKVGDIRGAYGNNVTPGLNLAFMLSVLYHGMIPIVTYALATMGGWILTMKSSTLSTLGEDYINAAQARGLPQSRIITTYVARNAMLPLVTRLAISFGFVVGGSVIIETIVVYPGLGKLLLDSIAVRDYTTMQGVFLVIAFAVVISNILADLMYGLLDPRVRIDKKAD